MTGPPPTTGDRPPQSAVKGAWTWAKRAPGVVGLVLAVDLLASAGMRQALVVRNERATVLAEISQEPYRGTDWGPAYWEEIARLCGERGIRTSSTESARCTAGS